MNRSSAALCVALALSIASAHAADRVALVIGVDTYDHLPPDAQLQVAVSDAEKMAGALEKVDPPFAVTLLTEVEQRDAEDALETFVVEAADAECALVYFAGHGIEYHGENFLLLRDTRVDRISADVQRMKRLLRNDALSMQVLVDELDLTGAQVKVVILDACRNNPLTVEAPGGTRSAFGGTRGLAQVTPPSGSLIAYSADAGQQANDGLFTEVLVSHLAKPGLPLLEVFAATREKVAETSRAWAKEDEEKRIPVPYRRVFHEPAEYTKLNRAGTKFAFTKGERPEIAAMREQIEALKETVALLRAQGSENEALRAQVERMENSLTEAESGAEAMRSDSTGGNSSQGEPSEIEAMGERLNHLLALLATNERKLAEETEVEKRRRLKEEIALLQGEIATMKALLGVGAPSKPMARTDPAPDAFPASRGMEGTRAGEVREFGGIEMVWCPPGTFLMGSPDDEEGRDVDETQHEVTLTRGYWLAKTECTQEQWESVMGSNPSHFEGSSDLPVEMVSWEDAQEWLAKMKERHPLPEGWEWALPTEVQWEYACRAGTSTATAFGDSLSSEEANFDGNYPSGGADKGPYLEKTVEVGSYVANGWGLYDMHGNVGEWCEDWYGEYPSGAVTDPTGSRDGSIRVNRGGCWSFSGLSCRSAFRNWNGPDLRISALGFRPAVSSTR